MLSFFQRHEAIAKRYVRPSRRRGVARGVETDAANDDGARGDESE